MTNQAVRQQDSRLVGLVIFWTYAKRLGHCALRQAARDAAFADALDKDACEGRRVGRATAVG